MKKLIVLCGATIALAGCYPTTYTHIEKADNGYVLTKNQAGFIRVHGEVWYCTPEGKTLQCKQTGEK